MADQRCNSSDYKKFSSVLIILASVSLGLLLPQIGSIWQPYTSVILGFLMFMVALNIDPAALIRSVQEYRSIIFALIMVFVVPPLLALPAQLFFSPVQYVAIVLALSAPAAVSSVFWCSIFRGHTPLALIVSISSNLIAIVTIPLTMLVLVGVTAPVNVAAIFLNLIYIIVIPITAAQIVKKLFSRTSKKIVNKSAPIQHAAFFLLLWGAVSAGATFTRSHPVDFLFFNLFFLSVFSVNFLIAYLVGRRFSRAHGIALALVSSHKNSVLAIVIGSLLLGSVALPPLIANVVAQNLFLVPARAALGKE